MVACQALPCRPCLAPRATEGTLGRWSRCLGLRGKPGTVDLLFEALLAASRDSFLTYPAKMAGVPAALSYELHKLTARLDRVADGLLRSHEGVSYSRFLALFAVSQGAASQRELARWLGQTEPSTSRMVGVLTAMGWLNATRVNGAGNRRRLQLTESGVEIVARCGRLLEAGFEDLVKRSGVPYTAYQRHTRRLLSQLDADQQVVATPEAA